MAFEKSILAALQENFPKTNNEHWKQTASKEIEGKDPYVELRWTTADGIDLLPYYDYESIQGLDYLENFTFAPAENSFLGARQWFNTPLVTVNDEITANKISLNHLANGADGIIFSFGKRNGLKLERLLENIEWPYCSLSFEVPEKNFSDKTLRDFVSKNYTDTLALSGSLFWESFPKSIDLDFYFSSIKNFKPLGLKIQPSTSATEIAQALHHSVKFFESSASDSKALEFFSAITFSIPCGNNFLETIAKLKVLRMLWFQIAQAYGLKEFQPSHLKIHARSEPWSQQNFQPHGNMIKATSCAIASILGGCDSITIFAEDEINEMMSRVARNVSNILREESHLNKVSDPVAGSYVMENFQNELASRAWALFQSKMKNG
jgi:methylmalonyl-CoA mutase